MLVVPLVVSYSNGVICDSLESKKDIFVGKGKDISKKGIYLSYTVLLSVAKMFISCSVVLFYFYQTSFNLD